MRARFSFAARIVFMAAMLGSAAQADPQRDFTLFEPGAEFIRAGGPIRYLPVGGSSAAPPIEPHVRAPLSADVGTVVAGNNAFALDLYRRLSSGAQPSDNLLVSPLSISTALGMTYAGARARTAQQMANVLHFTLPGDRLHAAFGELMRDLGKDREGYQLSIVNRLFGQAGYPFKQPFLDTTGNDYGAPLEPVDFKSDHEAARLRINDWVEDRTHDKIRDLLPKGSIDDKARLVLTNAIYFDGSWKHEFDKAATRFEPFYANGGDAPVSMMNQLRHFQYADLPSFQMLEMPYAGDDLSLVALLPKERGGLAGLEASLTPDLWNSSVAALGETNVIVTLPKFKFDSSFSLADSLKELGMTDAFDKHLADFRDIADPLDEKLVISKVLHKTLIDVNEEGTEAAGATAVVMIGVTSACYCPPPPPKEFRADHPFLFALRDRHSGSLLFLGRVTDPGALAATAAAPVPEPACWILVSMIGVASWWRRRTIWGVAPATHDQPIST